MQFLSGLSKSKVAKTTAFALVLASVVSFVGLSLASVGAGPNNFTVRVYDGDPINENKIANATVTLVADDSNNPSNGLSAATDGNGIASFNVDTGAFTVQIRADGYYGQDFRMLIDDNITFDASLIRMQTEPNPTPDPTPVLGECQPTPPRGRPMLNIWPIADSGADCTDYPLLAARNVSNNSDYSHSVSATDGQTIRVRLYVHNGVLDFPENVAVNTMVKASLPSASGTITAEAWANNADRINSAQKGGNVEVSLGSNQYLEFIPGSVQLFGRNAAPLGQGSDSVVTSGQSLGDMHGCFPFLRFVTFEVRVKTHAVNPPPPAPNPNPTPVPPPAPNPPTPVPPPPPAQGAITISKTVRNVTRGDSSFAEQVTANPGDQVEFSILLGIQNSVNNINVSDTLPSRLLYVNNSARIDGTDAGNNLTHLYVGNRANTQVRVTLRATVAAASQFSAGDTQLVNVTAMSSSVGNGSDTAKVIVHVEPTVVPPPPPAQGAISLQKTVKNVTDNTGYQSSVSADPADTVEFKLAVGVTNTVNNIVLSDVLPSRLAYVNNTLRIDGQLAGYDLNSINIGTKTSTTVNVTFQATVASRSQFGTGTTTLVNTANVTSNSGSASSSANVVVTIDGGHSSGGSASLSIDKQVRNITANNGFGDVTSARANERVEFRITVKNTGNRTADDVIVSDSLPGQLNYVSNTFRVDGNLVNPGSFFGNGYNLGDMSSGSSKTVTFEASTPSSVTSNYTVVNTATADADNTGSVSDSASVVFNAVIGTNVDIRLSKKAYNVTRGVDATTVAAQPGDVIQYTLTTENVGNATASAYVVQDNIKDILELSELQNFAGANLNYGTNVLSWPAQDISAGGKVEKTFTVRVRSTIPTGTDYVMTNVYGNTVNVSVFKFVAPPTGSTTTMAFALAFASAVGAFAVRKFRLPLTRALFGVK